MKIGSRTDPPQGARQAADGLLGLLAMSLALSTTGMEIAVVGLLLLSAAAVVGGWGVVRRTPLDATLGLFLGLCALSTAASLHVRDAVGWRSMWILATYFVVFWWVRDHPHAGGA